MINKYAQARRTFGLYNIIIYDLRGYIVRKKIVNSACYECNVINTCVRFYNCPVHK